MSKLVEFIGGPFAGEQPLPGDCPDNMGMPLDEDMRPIRGGKPFAYAIYRRKSADGVTRYYFMHVQTPDQQPFPVEFVDGPHQGTHPFPQPTQFCPRQLELPLSDDMMPFSDKGEPAAVAVYERRKTEGKWRYHLVRVDESVVAVEQAKAEINAHRLRCAINQFYAAPRDSIYSVQPTGEHEQVSIEHRHRRAAVDEGIAPLVIEVWRYGFDTLGSCQGRASGKAYVAFPIAEQGHAFHKILSQGGIQSTCEDKRLRVASVSARDAVVDESELITFDALNVMFSPEDIPRIADLLRASRDKTHPG